MSYRFSTQRDGQLLVVVFEGEITPQEEEQALHDVGHVPGLLPTADVLVDRRTARITAGSEHVRKQIDLAQSEFPTEGRPRMAMVVSADVDFGMVRMLMLRGEDLLPHDLHVFRSLEDACSWLDLEPAEIDWP